MFANNTAMQVGNLDAFNTVHVTNMAHMFENNTAIAWNTDLHNFYTPSLTDTGMVGMFNGCTNLATLDMSHFNTSGVTSMKDLFKGCVNMTELHLNNFDMTNDPVKTDMCTGLAANANQNNDGNNMCQIWCSNPVEQAMSSGTGINLNKVHFNDIVVSK